MNIFRMNKSILAVILIQALTLLLREWKRDPDDIYSNKGERNYFTLEKMFSC